MPWRRTQSTFAGALLQPERAVPDEVTRRDNRPSERRFNVYRNNVVVSLRESLESTFPVVRQMVGEDFFAAMARSFIRQSLPKTPVLIEYGADFSDFISRFQPAQGLPYLADLAGLEYASLMAYHGPNAVPATIDVLANRPEDQIEEARFAFHPTLALLTSEWLVFSLWQAHQEDDPQLHLSEVECQPECGLVVRPNLNVHIRTLDPLVYDFVVKLRDDHSLGEAVETITDFDQARLSEVIAALFEMQIVAGIRYV